MEYRVFQTKPATLAARIELPILNDRHETRSTMATSQFPGDRWHDIIGAPALADAIPDRLAHHATIIETRAESYRKSSSQQRRISMKQTATALQPESASINIADRSK